MADSGRKQEILDAARREFIKEGISGARTKAIAANIGVTKAMIHYYFDTKENLFREVFRDASETLMNGLMDILHEDMILFPKIERFIDQLLNRFSEQPELTRFIATELNQHADITQPIFEKACRYNAEVFRKQLDEAASNYEIAPVEAPQVVANIFSLCMFPYSNRRILQTALALNDEDYRGPFLSKRRELIKDTIINALAG